MVLRTIRGAFAGIMLLTHTLNAQPVDRMDSEKLLALIDSLRAAIESRDLGKGAQMNLQISREIRAQMRAGQLPPAEALAAVERSLPTAPEVERLGLMSKAARLALATGDIDKSQRYSSQILDIAGSQSGWKRSIALHLGHTALGLVELKKGNVAQAKFHLIASSQVSAEATLSSFGPTAILAKELLEKGEREVVLEYFEQCRRFWSAGTSRLDEWVAAVKSGQMPRFGSNLAY